MHLLRVLISGRYHLSKPISISPFNTPQAGIALSSRDRRHPPRITLFRSTSRLLLSKMATTTNAPAPENPELVIRKLDDHITIFSSTFARGGRIPFGGRSTAIKLKDNSVWVIPSTPLDPQTLSTLNALGTVQYLVSPDLEHNMFLSQYAKAFPSAALYIPSTIHDKWSKAGSGNEDLAKRTTFVFGKGKPDPFDALTQGEIQSVDFGKAFANEDIAFLHVPTKTLIEADLLFNLPPTEQYSKSTKKTTFPLFTSGMRPGGLMHKRLLWYMLGKDKAEMSKNAKLVSAWDFDRIIPCHGDVITSGAKEAWNSTYDWYINGKK